MLKKRDLDPDMRALLEPQVLHLHRLVGGEVLAIYPHTGAILAGGEVQQRWAWSDYLSGSWDGEESVFSAQAIDPTLPDLQLEFAEEDNGDIAIIVADRIESSIVHTETADLADGIVRVLVRRNPDGSCFTQTVTTASESSVRTGISVIDELETSVRMAVGLPIN